MKLKYIIITIIVLCVFAMIGNNDNGNKNNNNTNNKIISVPKGIEVVSHKKTSTFKIETIIKNNTGKELKSIKIIAECYDKNNNNLGKASDGKYNVNTKDNHKIDIFCDSETERYNLYIEYEQ